MLPQRFSIRQPKSLFIRVSNETPGPIAQGMKAILKVIIHTPDKAEGKIQDEFQLITKTEVYKIPISAHILSEEEFNTEQSEAFKANNRPLLLPNVREKGKEEKKVGAMEVSLGKLGNHDNLNHIGASGANETSLSGVNLPKISQIDDTQIELDPNKKIEDILKKQAATKEGH